MTASDNLTLQFRSHSVFSFRFLGYIVIIAVTVLAIVVSMAPPEWLFDFRFLAIVVAVLVFLCMVFTGWRLIVQKKGGVPPIRFEADHLSLPPHIHSLRAFRLPYGDIVALTKRGKRNANLTLDAKNNYFVYPLKDFAAADTFEVADAELRRRIGARPDGAAQLEAMRLQQGRAEFLTRIPARATWAIAAAMVLVFIFLRVWTSDHPLGFIDLGANAGVLTFSGEWYRLFTANLLHLNETHIFSNLIFLLVLGPLTERILGVKRFLLLVLSTGVVSQLASALWNQLDPATVGAFSVGISGALFGILGALAVLHYHFRGQLPLSLRFTARFWWIMLGLNFVLTPLITENVDLSAHISGLVSGFAVGWLLCRKQRQLTEPPPFTGGYMLSLTGLAVMGCVSVIIVALHLLNPDARRTNYAAMMEAALHMTPNVVINNQLSWAFAADPSASDAQLHTALELAKRTAQTVHQQKIVPQEDIDAYTDTLATLYYRTGNLEEAINSEATLRTLESTKMSQIARFLGRYLKEHSGPRLLDVSSGQLPEVSQGNALMANKMTLAVRLPGSVPHGARLYVLVRMRDHILGVVLAAIPPNSVPATYDVPIAAKLTGGATLTLAEVDATGCGCKTENGPVAEFFAMDKDVSELP